MSVRDQAVYFFADERRRYVKIGVSSNPGWRVIDLQAGSPFKLRVEHLLWFEERKDAFVYEDALHQLFAAHWRHGEWFDYTKPIKDFVAGWKRGEHQTVYKPAHTAQQFVCKEGYCLPKAEYMARRKEELRK